MHHVEQAPVIRDTVCALGLSLLCWLCGKFTALFKIYLSVCCYKLMFSDVYECCKALSVSTAVRISRRIKKADLGYAQTSHLVSYCTFERILLEDVAAE